jgi:predicted MFS family arabinose efflux permease
VAARSARSATARSTAAVLDEPYSPPQPQPAAPPSATLVFTPYQRFVIGLLAVLQFTIVLDFMIIAPLGAMVMPVLRITPSQFGLIVSTYAFSAGVAGVLTAGFADRFDRRRLLLLFYGGFAAGTLLCALASSYPLLLIGRLVTGLFAGVVGSVSFAIVTDLFPFELRGRVMGVIQTAFGASTVLGIPAALLLAAHSGWNMPFFLIVALSLVVLAVILARLKPITEHLRYRIDRGAWRHLVHTLSRRWYLQGFMTTCLLSIGGFTLMPFMSAFVVNNVGIPVARLPLVYVLIGALSVLAGPVVGRLSDRVGKYSVFAAGCAVTIVMVLIYTHLGPTPLRLLVPIMGALQVGVFSRIISASALMSAIPAPQDRGAYMAIASSVQQMAGGIAASVAGSIVVQTSAGLLRHYDTLGYIVLLTTLISVALMFFISRRVEGHATARR